MILAPIPQDEPQRILAVHSLSVLDSEPEERFDRITRIVQLIFNIPYVFITLIDHDRVWIKSSQGTDLVQEPRDASFCGHTICKMATNNPGSRLLEVADAAQDPRFHDNPHVTGAASNRFYIGFALQSSGKKNVGTLCMIDARPRNLTSVEKEVFTTLGLIAESELIKNEASLHDETQASQPSISKSELSNIDDNVNYFFKFSDTANKMVKNMENYLRKRGISYNEWKVLNEICQSSSTTSNNVSLKTGISPASVSHLVRSLEAKNLIERKSAENLENKMLHLLSTDDGKELWKYGLSRAAIIGGESMLANVLLDSENTRNPSN